MHRSSITLSVFHYPLSVILYPLFTILYPLLLSTFHFPLSTIHFLNNISYRFPAQTNNFFVNAFRELFGTVG